MYITFLNLMKKITKIEISVNVRDIIYIKPFYKVESQ